MKKLGLPVALFAATVLLANAGIKAFDVTPEWLAVIESLAPGNPAAKIETPRNALLFSRMTGYKHWVTPHTAGVIKILGRKSGAFNVVESNDVEMFAPGNIKQFDVIILNNTCSETKKRDLFWDATHDRARAAMLEKSLLEHIAGGAGLVAIHGAITMQNNSMAFSEMLGGSFDFHPRQQEVVCKLVDPQHPLVEPFKGLPFVHEDEPYLFKNAYGDKNFRPLLEMDTAKLDCGNRTESVRSDKRYVAWIKRYGKGRVFYCSPSHNARSFEKPELLQFILNGIRYAGGDLDCDDSPMERSAP